jgi:hypothetical protein
LPVIYHVLCGVQKLHQSYNLFSKCSSFGHSCGNFANKFNRLSSGALSQSSEPIRKVANVYRLPPPPYKSGREKIEYFAGEKYFHFVFVFFVNPVN